MDFKGGQWCRLVKLVNGDIGIIGHIFQIKFIDRDYLYPTMDTEGEGGCWHKDGCRLINLYNEELLGENVVTRYKIWADKQQNLQTTH